MQKNLSTRSNPLWRKTVTIAFLPIIIVIWTTGWILTQIGSQGKTPEIRQATFHNHPKFKAEKDESPALDEDSKVACEQEIDV